MGYNYEKLRPQLFTESGMEILIGIRDEAKRLLNEAGAVRADKAMRTVSGDSWTMCAALDYLVEKGELRRVTTDTMSQYQVFVRGDGE
jgi:hypothetical protein